MKLIKTKDKFILASDEDAKNNELLYNLENNTICRAMGDAEVSHFKIISEKPDFSLLKEKDCKEIGWVDVEKLALEAFKQGITFSHKEFSDTAYNRFRTWFSQTKTAQSLNDKQFSLDDMQKAIQFGLNGMYGYKQGEDGHTEVQKNKYIQSLQQTSWDVEVNELNQITKIL